MTRQQIKKRLINILSISPDLEQIMLSDMDYQDKRDQINGWLSDMLAATYKENPGMHPLEYILARDAIAIFRKILSKRSENMAGFSVLKYMNDLLCKESDAQLDRPKPGFFAELEHFIKGVVGKTGIYDDKVPAYHKHKGRKAARMRSTDLSRMARKSEALTQRYACGLDHDAVRRRNRNKMRISRYFGATESDWQNWRWHTRNIIRDADTLKQLVKLTDAEYQGVKRARESKIPFGITPHYLSLMDYDVGGQRDMAVRAQVLPSLHYVEKLAEHRNDDSHSMDFMLEMETSPIEGITRRYPDIVILKPVMTCPQICVYCQRNWEIEDVYSTQAVLSKEKLERAIQWIQNTPEIKEVLITGGDPLLLSNKRLERIISKVAANPNIQRIRIGTRTPVTLPARITDQLVSGISRFHVPGRREIIIVTHFEHPYEITPQSMQAVQKFRRHGMEVYNQLVYTFFNSRRFEATLLRQKLRLIGVTPYYTFNTKGKEETDEYRVPIPRLLQEQNEEARLLPGTVRTDEIVFNVPGLGKNYLKARQHHDVISFLPDGSRVYEFHPWEEKLALVDTYIYQDVPIYNYLKRLKSAGEETANYRSIWYYY